MILSRAHNFIFVKTRKVAGTSIELALSPHCGPNDVLTPTDFEDDVLRYHMGALRNFCNDPQLEEDYRGAVIRGDSISGSRAMRAIKLNRKFWSHMPARDIRQAVEEPFWNSAFKFSVMRNPYDYVVSIVYYRSYQHRTASTPDVRARTLAHVMRRAVHNSDLVTIDGKLAVDKVLRYENLREDLRAIAPNIGIDISNLLPLAKTVARPREASVKATLSPLARLMVRWRWRRDFKLYASLTGPS